MGNEWHYLIICFLPCFLWSVFWSKYLAMLKFLGVKLGMRLNGDFRLPCCFFFFKKKNNLLACRWKSVLSRPRIEPQLWRPQTHPLVPVMNNWQGTQNTISSAPSFVVWGRMLHSRVINKSPPVQVFSQNNTITLPGKHDEIRTAAGVADKTTLLMMMMMI